MNISNLSVKNLCLLTEGGMVLSMLVIIAVLYGVTADQVIVAAGTALIGCAVVWLRILAVLFGKRLSLFTTDLCCMLDDMMDGSHGPQSVNDSETLFARIHHRVTRLYTMMQENRRKVDEERQELPGVGVPHISSGKNADQQFETGNGYAADQACHRVGADCFFAGHWQPD